MNSSCRRSLFVVIALFVAVLMQTAGSTVQAQTPVVTPSTITSIAGATPTTSTLNTACTTNPQFTATDALGDGCPAVNATMTGDERSMTVDPQGNVYFINDTVNPQSVRRIDQRTGNVSIFAGFGAGGSLCGTPVTVDGTLYTQTDKTGDGCPVAYSGGFNGGRGLGSTPYGNIIITVTGDYALHFVCNAVSPLCSAAQVQVNLMRNIAGCTPSVSGYGTSVAGTTAGSAGDGTLATQFSGTCSVGINSPRQAVGDQWENIYFADNANLRIRVVLGVPSITVNGNTLVNPLYAVLATSTGTGVNFSTPTQGYIYPIAGGGTACTGNTDAGGDGCPFYQTVVGSSSSGSIVQGLAVESAGDFLFTDGLGRLRVIYMGGTTIRTALAANGITSPQIGYSYALIGNGLGTAGVTGGTLNLYYNSASLGYTLGKNDSLQTNTIQRLAVDAAGNIYIGDQAQVLFYDIYTGYVHRLGGATTAVSCNSSAIGDGCPVTQSLFGAASSVLSVNLDNIGNLYIQDLTNRVIRRVSASLLPTTAVHGSLTSNVVVHSPVAASSVAITAAPGSDFTLGSSTCATTSADGSNECTATATYAPALLAQRSVPITVAATVGSTTTKINSALTANSTGNALVFDTASAPSTSVLGAAATGSTTLVMDTLGNQYVSGTPGISRISGSTVTNIAVTPATYIAVDAQGNVYAANAGATSIRKYVYSAASGTYTSGTVSIPLVSMNGTSTTQGSTGPMVVDVFGTIYIADTTSKQLIKFVPGTGIAQQVTQTALTSPTAMSQDAYGNLLIVNGTSVLKVPAAGLTISTSSPIATPSVIFPVALVAPTAVAADQGGNLYVADSGNIIALSTSGYEYAIPGISGSSVTVDGAGNLYTASSTVAGVTKVNRNAESHDFGTDVATAYVGVFSNTGATAATGFNLTETGGNYSFLAPATPLAVSGPTCTMGVMALPGGTLCNISIKFAPTAVGTGPVPNTITLLPTPTLGSLALNGTKNGSTATTTTVITGNTAGLVYSTSTETTFTVTVTQSIGTPSGTVSIQIDGGTAVNYNLVSGSGATATASVVIAGRTAVAHTIVANYGGSSGIAGSTSTPVSFTIAPASTSVSWTPGALTQQVSAAIGASVLNATSVGSIPGAFTYTATPSGGTATAIDAASNLTLGSYTLGVTFTPTDLVDYTTSTASGGTYTVTQATTTAPVGASQFVVAADGSGNYTTVQAAVNALGATGGSVYIRPGTYNGLISVVQPNVALRGLGGDPTQVILTHSGGAFSVNAGSVYNFTAEFNASNSNGAQLPSGSSLFSGDQGSSTMVVAKGINTAFGSSTLMPYNFYAENLSINNTYNTDTSTTTTTQVVNNVCTANAGVAQTYNSLFNAGKQCASQALAIWVTGDQAIFNNVYTTSLQDTVYAGSGGCGSPCTVSRQYWWRGKITGTVDYIFGDAAAVFDHDNIYSLPHGTGVSGTATIEAQNKQAQSGGSSDYLSGYVFNHSTFTSQVSGMTGLVYGRPYGPYSTMILLNSYVDQIAPGGWIEFSGDTNLPTSTYAEYNTIPYTDPATGSADINGIIYTGTGGSIGAGVTGVRETTSQDPGTPMALNTIKTQMTAAQAAAYYPVAFLGTKVGAGGVGTLATGSTAIWNPTAALATSVNAFVPTSATATVNMNGSITILMRPQAPGGGILPTGTYTLKDGSATIASGTLDATGEASYTTAALTSGPHSITWIYGGDANFAGSTTSAPLVLTVTSTPPGGFNTTTTIGIPNVSNVYGQVVTGTVTVAPTTGTGAPTGTVTLTLDGTPVAHALTAGAYSFSFTGLTQGSHTLSASYGGDANYNASTTSSPATISVAKAPLSVVVNTATSAYGAAFPAFSGTLSGVVNGDTITATYGTTATTTSAPGGSYSITATLVDPNSKLGNYTVTNSPAALTITKGTSTISGSTVTQTYGTATTSTITVAGGGATPTAATIGYTIDGGTAQTATLTGGTATVPVPASLTGGAHIIALTYGGDTNYNGSTGSVIFTTSAAPQTITFPALPAAPTYGVAPMTLGATASSGLAVSYAVTGPASLSGSTLTITGAGSVVVTATQAGNTNYSAATQSQQTLNVAKAPLTVTANAASMPYGGPLPTLTGTLAGVVGTDGITASYATNATVASAAGGTYTVTATLNDPNSKLTNYTVTNNSAVFTVTNGVTLTVTAANASRVYGAANPAFTASYTGQKNGDTFTATASSAASATMPVGAASIVPAVVGANIADYTVALVNGVLTITKANTAVTLVQTLPVTSGVGTGTLATFSATVTDTSAGSTGTPTGSVQLLDGSTLIGTGTLTAGVATITTTFTTAATHVLTAVYQGDTNFSTSTSAAVSEVVQTPGFSMTANPNSLTIARGSSGTTTITFTPTGNYQGSLSLACNGLPAFASCLFTPSAITFTGNNAVQTSVLQVYTLNAAAVAGGSKSGLLWLPAGMLACLIAIRRRKLMRGLRPLQMIAMAVFTLIAMSAVSGCGGGSFVTPTGSSTMTVSAAATGSGGSGNSTQTLTINITITQ